MFWWLKEILSSLRFIAIHGDQGFFKSKRMYEFVLPAGAATAIATIYLSFPSIFVAGFLKNLSGNVFQVMVFVVPFHLAALAAISTYQAPGLNDRLPGSEAQLKVWSNEDNEFNFINVTLRQYASLLFGYLCTIGIAYVLIYIFASNVDLSASGASYQLCHNAVLFLSFFFIFHYLLLTIYAVTFLFDKVNKIRST